MVGFLHTWQRQISKQNLHAFYPNLGLVHKAISIPDCTEYAQISVAYMILISRLDIIWCPDVNVFIWFTHSCKQLFRHERTDGQIIRQMLPSALSPNLAPYFVHLYSVIRGTEVMAYLAMWQRRVTINKNLNSRNVIVLPHKHLTLHQLVISPQTLAWHEENP